MITDNLHLTSLPFKQKPPILAQSAATLLIIKNPNITLIDNVSTYADYFSTSGHFSFNNVSSLKSSNPTFFALDS